MFLRYETPKKKKEVKLVLYLVVHIYWLKCFIPSSRWNSAMRQVRQKQVKPRKQEPADKPKEELTAASRVWNSVRSNAVRSQTRREMQRRREGDAESLRGRLGRARDAFAAGDRKRSAVSPVHLSILCFNACQLSQHEELFLQIKR